VLQSPTSIRLFDDYVLYLHREDDEAFRVLPNVAILNTQSETWGLVMLPVPTTQLVNALVLQQVSNST